MKNYFYNKNIWSVAKSDVKQFARYGLISFTNHSSEQIINRGFSKDLIVQLLIKSNTEIVQYHEKGTYNSNRSDLVVFLAKYKDCRKNIKRLHIVVALEKDNNVPNYKIITAYEPSKELFYASGRVVKPLKRGYF